MHALSSMLLAALWLAAIPGPAMAQPLAPAASAAGSAPARVAPAPRPSKAAGPRDNPAPPGDMRPESPVTHQLVIPLGKAPDPPAPAKPQTARRGASAAPGSIDDAVARCRAVVGKAARAKCRAGQANEVRPAGPG